VKFYRGEVEICKPKKWWEIHKRARVLPDRFIVSSISFDSSGGTTIILEDKQTVLNKYRYE